MTRRLLFLNVLFLGVAAAAGLYIAREMTAPLPRPAGPRPRAAATTPAQPATPVPAAESAPGSYAAVASRNLFSPTRTEAPPVATQARPTPPPVKPNLHGVVLRDGGPIAFLEDPTTKRVAGYHVGDSIAGATVETIQEDRVVLARPDGQLSVRLRDPSKPRPVAAVPTGAAQPGHLPTQPQPMPGAPPAPPIVTMPGTSPMPAMPTPQTTPGFPSRRPAPNILRRVPPANTDAAQQ